MNKILKDWSTFEKTLLFVATTLMVVLSIIWKDSPIGLISSITGIISVILCAKGKISNYVVGTIYVSTYAIIAFQNKFYGEVMLNMLYYIPMNIIGFVMWSKVAKKKVEETNEVITRSLSGKAKLITLGVGLVAIVLYWQLLNLMGGNLAFIDSVTTITSIIAMYLQVTRYTESWLMWIIVNITSIILWIVAMTTGDSNNITILLMWSAYLVNSSYGYINWKKLEKKVE